MLPNPATPASGIADDRGRLRRAFVIALEFTALLWLIKLAELIFGWDFSTFGVYPRHWIGLRGILLAPLIHASVGHLAANTGSVIILGTALLYGYPRAARLVIPVLYFGSGAGVWLFAREAYHIGASGLSFGMLSFIFTMGVLRWDRRAIALSLLVFFLYGGMLWGILPTTPGISFESHLSGAVIGIALAFLLKDRDPRPPEKHYGWEDETDDDADWLEEGGPEQGGDKEWPHSGGILPESGKRQSEHNRRSTGLAPRRLSMIHE